MAGSRRIGIDLGGTKIEGAVLDAAGRPIVRQRVPTERQRGYEHIIEATGALVDVLRAAAPECTAVGVGTPGAMSTRSGLLKNSNTACLNGRDLLGDLRARIGLPVIVENDANCFALAEAI